MPGYRRFAVPLLLCMSCAADQPQTPQQIVARSMQNDNGGWIRARDYTFLERIEEHKLDDQGKVRSVESKTYEVSILFGKPYNRLVMKNDKPLSPADAKAEDEKREKEIAKRKQQAEKEKKPVDKEREEQQLMAREVPKAYDFKLVGEEQISGRPVYVIEAQPKQGYNPVNLQTKILPKLKGKLWIDKQDYQWVRVEAEVVSPFTIGLFLARLNPGAKLETRQTRVHGEVWLPEEVHFRFDARAALFKHWNEEFVVTFKDYRKFQSESRVLPVSEGAQ